MQLPNKWTVLTEYWRPSSGKNIFSWNLGVSSWCFLLVLYLNCAMLNYTWMWLQLKCSQIARVKAGGHFWAWDKISEVWTPMSDFPFWVLEQIREGGSRKECQHHVTSTSGLSLSDTEVIDWGIQALTFSTFDVLNLWKYKDGLFWRKFGRDVQLKLQSGRSALSNIDILFWEIPGSKKFRHF